MRRLISDDFRHSGAIKNLLDVISDRKTSVEDYRASFFSIGKELGVILRPFLSPDSINSTLLACASEDADWLASGFLSGAGVPELPIAVFWSTRERLSNGIDISPIIRTYRDDIKGDCENLIVIKSIISSSCVVKTQLMRLISDLSPAKIYILAPVMYKDASRNLKMDFPEEISSKFEFITFAVDDEKNSDNEVIPGIGGMVYPRLGLGTENEKNTYIPKIVRDRMGC